jgi:hypothetical protein
VNPEARPPTIRPGAIRLILLTFFVAVFVIVAGWVWPTCRTIWKFDHIEGKARKRVTAAELQMWATNLLANPPTGRVTVASLGTNFPAGLRGLWRYDPSVVLNQTRTNDGEPMPGWVHLMWGSGMLGHCGFEIGPTNFLGNRGTSVWSAGVYFWKSP